MVDLYLMNIFKKNVTLKRFWKLLIILDSVENVVSRFSKPTIASLKKNRIACNKQNINVPFYRK